MVSSYRFEEDFGQTFDHVYNKLRSVLIKIGSMFSGGWNIRKKFPVKKVLGASMIASVSCWNTCTSTRKNIKKFRNNLKKKMKIYLSKKLKQSLMFANK